MLYQTTSPSNFYNTISLISILKFFMSSIPTSIIWLNILHCTFKWLFVECQKHKMVFEFINKYIFQVVCLVLYGATLIPSDDHNAERLRHHNFLQTQVCFNWISQGSPSRLNSSKCFDNSASWGKWVAMSYDQL